jgi:UDP-N-acetyl-D-mannosaminuronic acid dehydrogenase
VLGVEIRSDQVDKINAGICPIEGNEPGLAELLRRVMETCVLRATTDYAELADRDVFLIAVETPVDENNVPRYEALRSAITSLAQVMKDGSLVIVESTVAPRAMQILSCLCLKNRVVKI